MTIPMLSLVLKDAALDSSLKFRVKKSKSWKKDRITSEKKSDLRIRFIYNVCMVSYLVIADTTLKYLKKIDSNFETWLARRIIGQFFIFIFCLMNREIVRKNSFKNLVFMVFINQTNNQYDDNYKEKIELVKLSVENQQQL